LRFPSRKASREAPPWNARPSGDRCFTLIFHFTLSIKQNLDLGNLASSRIFAKREKGSPRKPVSLSACVFRRRFNARTSERCECVSVTSLVLHVRGLTNRNRFRYIGTSLASGLDARASTLAHSARFTAVQISASQSSN